MFVIVEIKGAIILGGKLCGFYDISKHITTLNTVAPPSVH